MFGLILLLSMCVGVIKVAHDSGCSKIYFILAMAISAWVVTQNWLATLLFLAPLAVYVQETGDLHKLNKTNTPEWDEETLEYFKYALFVSGCFAIPFIYTHSAFGFVLFLWPLLLRNLVMVNSKWWHVSVFVLFFSYSWLFLWSW